MPYGNKKISVKIPHSSGFDKSHRYTGSGACGSLIPVLCDEVIPGTKVRLRVPASIQLPPLASETYMNASVKFEAFFVPMRLLCGSFESFFNDFPERVQITNNSDSDSSSAWADAKGVLPVFDISVGSRLLGPGTLADYLGICLSTASLADPTSKINSLPFVAYHLIWQEWYRNPRVQNPAFSKNLAGWPGQVYIGNYTKASVIPSTFYHDSVASYPSNYIFTDTSNFQLADGKSIFDLRQRNFGLDYFTSARVSAQQGSPAGVTLETVEPTATLTIASLRAANSLQQFRERNNLASPRFVDQIESRYGVRPSDGVAQRPICIGSATIDISTRGVDQTGVDSSSASSNPFNTVASQYGRGSAASNEFLIDSFEALEPGYIMVLQSLVPEVTYSYGVDPIFQRYLGPGSVVDMANPLLQNVGDEPIYCSELSGVSTSQPSSLGIFGYTDRFSKFMFKKNTVHGEMRPGRTLASYVLQRDFGTSVPTLSTNFLEIPKNYFDQIFAVSSGVSGLSYWFDIYFDYKVTMPLAEYSIPSLQDPAYEHGKTISIRRNGQIF